LEIDEGRAVRQFTVGFRHAAFPLDLGSANDTALKCTVNEFPH
jgi:hypothetical protein